jgi:chorismate synthase
MNSFGEKWTFTSFGESHGAAVGGVLDGVPAGLHISLDMIREELEKRAGRKPNLDPSLKGRETGVSPRALREPDEVEWLSGVMESDEVTKDQGTKGLVTLGTPIAFLIRNKDARPEDYEWLKHTYRVGHADKVYEQKYGIRDWRGGGRASARETAGRVVAGCLAKQQLAEKGITIHAELVQVGAEIDPALFAETIAAYQKDGDSIGGIVECRIDGLPVGTGEPIFDKLQAHLAFAVMSINACKGFAYGTGFEGVTEPGSVINHISGGIAGGISDGSEIVFRCVFKPTPTTPKALKKLNDQRVNVKMVNRSDACVAVRAVPVVEAMTALALVQFL